MPQSPSYYNDEAKNRKSNTRIKTLSLCVFFLLLSRFPKSVVSLLFCMRECANECDPFNINIGDLFIPLAAVVLCSALSKCLWTIQFQFFCSIFLYEHNRKKQTKMNTTINVCVLYLIHMMKRHTKFRKPLKTWKWQYRHGLYGRNVIICQQRANQSTGWSKKKHW